MPRAISIFYCLICLISFANAHTVSQIYGEWNDQQPWQLQLTFDAGYALPEMRSDQNAPQPTRDWLLGQNEANRKRLQTETEKYLRDALVMNSGGKTLTWTIEFPDFAQKVPTFPKTLNGGAYFNVIIRGEALIEGTPTLLWKPVPANPLLIIKLPTAPEQSVSNYLSINPNDSAAIQLSPSKRPAVLELFQLGFAHVVPHGIDHMLFICCLFLYRRNWKNLFNQSIAFTLAHSVTLGFAALGWIRVSPGWIEPLIALSIAFLAVENLWSQKQVPRYRLPLVFIFGLVHGLGFASALSAWLQPGKGFFTALISMNFGVEIAQASVLVTLWIMTLRWNTSEKYHFCRRIASIVIAAIGLYWTVERIWN